MSDILFCGTDISGFYQGAYDHSRSYQTNSLAELEPDILGLQSWYDYVGKIDFNDYGLIWLHLNPRIMFPPWFMFSALVKRMAPDVPVIVKHEWWEKYHSEPIPDIIKKYIRYADYLHTNTAVGRDVLEENFDIPVLYSHIGQPRLDDMMWPKTLPWKEREGIFSIQHTSKDSMIRKFEIGKITGLPMTVINSEPFTDGFRLQELGDAIGANANCYGRTGWVSYMDKMRRCRVALDIDYIGICRMAYECSRVSVPVVGTNLMEYQNMLYPKLVFDPDDVEGMTAKILEIHNGSVPKALNRRASKVRREHWSKEACRERLFQLFEEVGYES